MTMTQRATERQSSPTTTPHDSASRELRALNPQRALSLCNNDPDLARDLATLFLETASDLVAELHAATDSADAEAIGRVAHTLKGAAANLGGERLERAAKNLMRMGRNNQLPEAPARMEQLDQELARLRSALARFRAELESRAA